MSLFGIVQTTLGLLNMSQLDFLVDGALSVIIIFSIIISVFATDHIKKLFDTASGENKCTGLFQLSHDSEKAFDSTYCTHYV